MTKEQILNMLKEAWISEAEAEMLESDWGSLSEVYYQDLAKFAKLVAAHERKQCAFEAEWCIQNGVEHHIPGKIRARGQK